MIFGLFSKKQPSRPIRQRSFEIEQKILKYQSEIDALVANIGKKILLPDKELTEREVINTLIGKADSRHCISCGADFGKIIKRATVCPKCGDKVIVRSGLVITEELEKYYLKQWRSANEFYGYTGIKELSGSVIVKDYIYDIDYLSALISIANAFQKLNLNDRGWRILNSDVFEVTKSPRDWGKLYSARIDFIHKEKNNNNLSLINMCFLYAVSLIDMDSKMATEPHDLYIYEILSAAYNAGQDLKLSKSEFLEAFDKFALERKGSDNTKMLVRSYMAKNILNT